jgi:hypothetical protein
MQEDLASDAVVGVPYLFEMHQRIYSSKEGTVEPSSSL